MFDRLFRISVTSLLMWAWLFFVPVHFQLAIIFVAASALIVLMALKRISCLAVILCLLFMGLGYARSYFSDASLRSYQSTFPIESVQSFTGVVTSISQRPSGGEKVRICSDVCVDVLLSNKSPMSIGQSVRAEMQVLPPKAPFDRVAWSRWVVATGYLDTFQVLPAESTFFSLIANVRESLLESIDRSFPLPSSAFIRGILLGDDRSLTSEMRSDFRASWLTHLLVASGFNVTIILVMIWALTAKLPRVIRTMLALSSVVVFALLAGGEPPIIRASIMGSLAFLLTSWWVRVRVGHILLLVVSAFVLHRPYVLLYDAGFQLSCLAVGGLILLSWPLSRSLRYVPRVLWLRESLSATLAATIFTLPILIGTFEQVSLLSPIANLLVAPTIWWTMLAATLSLLLEMISPALGYTLGIGAYALSEYSIFIAHSIASLPYAFLTMDLGPYRAWIQIWILMLLALLALLAFLFSRSCRTR